MMEGLNSICYIVRTCVNATMYPTQHNNNNNNNNNNKKPLKFIILFPFMTSAPQCSHKSLPTSKWERFFFLCYHPEFHRNLFLKNYYLLKELHQGLRFTVRFFFCKVWRTSWGHILIFLFGVLAPFLTKTMLFL
jgi:hypothetical protein